MNFKTSEQIMQCKQLYLCWGVDNSQNVQQHDLFCSPECTSNPCTKNLLITSSSKWVATNPPSISVQPLKTEYCYSKMAVA